MKTRIDNTGAVRKYEKISAEKIEYISNNVLQLISNDLTLDLNKLKNDTTFIEIEGTKLNDGRFYIIDSKTENDRIYIQFFNVEATAANKHTETIDFTFNVKIFPDFIPKDVSVIPSVLLQDGTLYLDLNKKRILIGHNVYPHINDVIAKWQSDIEYNLNDMVFANNGIYVSLVSRNKDHNVSNLVYWKNIFEILNEEYFPEVVYDNIQNTFTASAGRITVNGSLRNIPQLRKKIKLSSSTYELGNNGMPLDATDSLQVSVDYVENVEPLMTGPFTPNGKEVYFYDPNMKAEGVSSQTDVWKISAADSDENIFISPKYCIQSEFVINNSRLLKFRQVSLWFPSTTGYDVSDSSYKWYNLKEGQVPFLTSNLYFDNKQARDTYFQENDPLSKEKAYTRDIDDLDQDDLLNINQTEKTIRYCGIWNDSSHTTATYQIYRNSYKELGRPSKVRIFVIDNNLDLRSYSDEYGNLTDSVESICLKSNVNIQLLQELDLSSYESDPNAFFVRTDILDEAHLKQNKYILIKFIPKTGYEVIPSTHLFSSIEDCQAYFNNNQSELSEVSKTYNNHVMVNTKSYDLTSQNLGWQVLPAVPIRVPNLIKSYTSEDQLIDFASANPDLFLTDQYTYEVIKTPDIAGKVVGVWKHSINYMKKEISENDISYTEVLNKVKNSNSTINNINCNLQVITNNTLFKVVDNTTTGVHNGSIQVINLANNTITQEISFNGTIKFISLTYLRNGIIVYEGTTKKFRLLNLNDFSIQDIISPTEEIAFSLCLCSQDFVGSSDGISLDALFTYNPETNSVTPRADITLNFDDFVNKPFCINQTLSNNQTAYWFSRSLGIEDQDLSYEYKDGMLTKYLFGDFPVIPIAKEIGNPAEKVKNIYTLSKLNIGGVDYFILITTSDTNVFLQIVYNNLTDKTNGLLKVLNLKSLNNEITPEIINGMSSYDFVSPTTRDSLLYLSFPELGKIYLTDVNNLISNKTIDFVSNFSEITSDYEIPAPFIYKVSQNTFAPISQGSGYVNGEIVSYNLNSVEPDDKTNIISFEVLTQKTDTNEIVSSVRLTEDSARASYQYQHNGNIELIGNEGTGLIINLQMNTILNKKDKSYFFKKNQNDNIVSICYQNQQHPYIIDTNYSLSADFKSINMFAINSYFDNNLNVWADGPDLSDNVYIWKDQVFPTKYDRDIWLNTNKQSPRIQDITDPLYCPRSFVGSYDPVNNIQEYYSITHDQKLLDPQWLNYNKGDSLWIIDSKYSFSSEADRDNYFALFPKELISNQKCCVIKTVGDTEKRIRQQYIIDYTAAEYRFENDKEYDEYFDTHTLEIQTGKVIIIGDRFYSMVLELDLNTISSEFDTMSQFQIDFNLNYSQYKEGDLILVKDTGYFQILLETLEIPANLQFGSNTERDIYFLNNPSLLVNLLKIMVGSEYQEYQSSTLSWLHYDLQLYYKNYIPLYRSNLIPTIYNWQDLSVNVGDLAFADQLVFTTYEERDQFFDNNPERLNVDNLRMYCPICKVQNNYFASLFIINITFNYQTSYDIYARFHRARISQQVFGSNPVFYDGWYYVFYTVKSTNLSAYDMFVIYNDPTGNKLLQNFLISSNFDVVIKIGAIKMVGNTLSAYTFGNTTQLRSFDPDSWEVDQGMSGTSRLKLHTYYPENGTYDDIVLDSQGNTQHIENINRTYQFNHGIRVMGQLDGLQANIIGISYRALYGDYAHYLESDCQYPVGTLVMFGGEKEITKAIDTFDFIVSSENPEDEQAGMIIGKKTKNSLPVCVSGKVKVLLEKNIVVKKFDNLYLGEDGRATNINTGKAFIGKALCNYYQDKGYNYTDIFIK